jgi:hypothetical protein
VAVGLHTEPAELEVLVQILMLELEAAVGAAKGETPQLVKTQAAVAAFLMAVAAAVTLLFNIT